jgi:hypothetical protein
MSKGNGEHKGAKVSKRDPAPPPAPVQSWVAIKPSGWQRFKSFLKKTFNSSSPKLMLLNDIPHLGKDQGPAAPLDSASLLKLEERVNTMELAIQKLSELQNRVDTLVEKLEKLRQEVLNRKFSGDENPDLKRNYGDPVRPSENLPPRSSAHLGGSTPKPAPKRSSASEPTFEALERALCQAMAGQTSTGLEIDTLLTDIRDQMGDVWIDVEYIGQRVTGQWHIAALFLPSTGQGLAIVNPNGLVDSEIMNFFEADIGRRVFACIQPARVARSGKQISVLRKGRVDSSS